MGFNIAIDGPAGAGKSSLAKKVAKTIGFIYVDTGALYRSVGLFAIENGVPTKDIEGVTGLLNNLKLELKFTDDGQRVILNGRDVSDLIRTQAVAMAASDVSAIPSVRAFLLDTQRDIAKQNNVLMDGRDVGTVILPNADLKVFLTASAEIRAKRRYDELIEKNILGDNTYEKILEDVKQRDHNDSTRAIAPLKRADDAVLLDNSNLDRQQTIDKLLEIIRSRIDV